MQALVLPIVGHCKRLGWVAAVASLALVAPAPNAANLPKAPEIERGDTMAHTCAACHGTNGVLGDEAFKPLAGMPVEQFVKAMIDFREGKRPATLMQHVARGFSDAEIRRMAEFFAAQTPLPVDKIVTGEAR